MKMRRWVAISSLLLACGLPILAAFAAEETQKQVPAAADFKEVEQLAKEAPGFAVDLYRLAGQTCLNRNQPARAVRIYSQALTVEPNNLLLLEDLANAQAAAGNKKEAVAVWQKILSTREEDIGTRIRYARFLLEKAGEGQEAVEVMRGVAAKQPANPALSYWIVDAYLRIGKSTDAAKELQGMLKLFPEEEPEIQRRLNGLAPVKTEPPKPAEAKSKP